MSDPRPLAADLRRVKWGKAGLPASARGRFTAPPSDEAEDAGEATGAEPAAGPAAEPPESTRAELVETPEPG